jgi:hypothetical protein
VVQRFGPADNQLGVARVLRHVETISTMVSSVEELAEATRERDELARQSR